MSHDLTKFFLKVPLVWYSPPSTLIKALTLVYVLLPGLCQPKPVMKNNSTQKTLIQHASDEKSFFFFFYQQTTQTPNDPCLAQTQAA